MKNNESVLLQYAIENGMIDVSVIQEQVNMKKRKEILKKHPYEIWAGTNNNWFTYVLDENGKRLLRKRASKDALEEYLVDYYKNKEEQKDKFLFCKCWESWKKTQESYGVSNNTLLKYDSDYKRFFSKEDIENKDIRSIDEEYITSYVIRKIKSLNLCKKSADALWGYVSGVFKSARIKKLISENPCEYVDKKMFSRFYYQKSEILKKRIVMDSELRLLIEQLQKDHAKDPCYPQSYAVELAVYSGMRVGELAGLKWSNVLFNDGIIVISNAEIYDRKTKEYIVAGTKNKKERIFPITENIKKMLLKLRKEQMKKGLVNEFVFSNENGKVTARSISECMRRKCTQAGIDERGIHSLRRTLNSKMRCQGVSAPIAASMLGHTEEVNNNHYTYDITGLDYKREILENISV